MKKIVDAAAVKNQQLGLTGYLAFNTRYCLQLLEGGNENLNKLYGQILSDERHHHLMLLGCCPISQRSFPDWGMNFAILTAEKRKIYFQFCATEEFLPNQMSYQSALELLTCLSKVS